jgi:hypothetical protein
VAFQKKTDTYKQVVKQEEVEAPEEPQEESPEDYFARQTAERQANKPAPTRNPALKKGDMVDGMLAAMNSSGMKKVDGMLQIKMRIEQRLHVRANNKKWENFIEFAYNREMKDKESIDVFITYALKEGFNPVYWTPEKMETLWPQAFIKEQIQQEELDDFTPPVPEIKKVEYMEMPTAFIKKRNLE